MARLYYEISEQTPRTRTRGKSSSEYFEKVAKLVPAELIAGYVALIGFVPLIRNSNLHPWFFGASFLLCLVLTPIYLNSQAEKGRPKRNHLVVSTVAFVFWAYAVSGSTTWPAIHDPAIASILLVAFSLVSGRIHLK